ncbi:MAG: hypothetical protein N2V76_05565 [Methanophagales archaeon]|nr:hypothetical protein [Methanophagales archaeon]
MKKSRSIVAIVMVAMLLAGVALAYASPPLERIPPQSYHRSGDWVKMLQRIYPATSETDDSAVSPTPTSIPSPPEPKTYIDIRISSSSSYAKPGQTILFNGTLTNNGDEDITVELVPISENGYMIGRVIKPEWVSVKPAELTLADGESEEFQISVTIPDDVDAGFYKGMLAVRPENSLELVEYYSIHVYRLLNEPVTEEFYVPQNSSRVVVTVTWSTGGYQFETGEEDLTVHLYRPSGQEIAPDTISTHISGYVDAHDYWRPSVEVIYDDIEGEMYKSGSGRVYKRYIVLYDIENPENGKWKLEMIPKDMVHFSYDIDVNPINFPKF